MKSEYEFLSPVKGFSAGIRPSLFRRSPFLLLGILLLPTWLHAATISGTVKDPSGAVIPNAQIEIIGGDLTQPLHVESDGLGQFSANVKPGKYELHVSKPGFEPLVQSVNASQDTELQLTLTIAVQQTNIEVPGLALANSDPLYRALRRVGLGQTFAIENFTVPIDVATFQLQKGTLTWLNPVEGQVTGAIFVGQGHFHLRAATKLDAQQIKHRTGEDEVEEDFTEVVFRFTREQRMVLLNGAGAQVEPSAEAPKVFDRWKENMRHRREIPLGFSEYVLTGESIDNVDADVLAAVYNPAHPPFFNAYLRGRKHKDLRFFLRRRVGAVPQLDSPEEVGLINYDPEGMEDGVWYLAHLRSEYEHHSASSQEDRRLFATKSYKIETVIAKNHHLFSTATIHFEPLIAGERVLKFALLPNLRVSRVFDDQGQNLHFIQESRKEDGSFYVVLQPLQRSARKLRSRWNTPEIKLWRKPAREVSMCWPAPPGIRT